MQASTTTMAALSAFICEELLHVEEKKKNKGSKGNIKKENKITLYSWKSHTVLVRTALSLSFIALSAWLLNPILVWKPNLISFC